MIRDVVNDGIRGTRGDVAAVSVVIIAVAAASVVIPIPGPVATGARGEVSVAQPASSSKPVAAGVRSGGFPLSPALLSRGCGLG